MRGALQQALQGAPRELGKQAFGWSPATSFTGGSAQNPGQAVPVFTRPQVLRFREHGRALINRQSLQLAPWGLKHEAWWR